MKYHLSIGIKSFTLFYMRLFLFKSDPEDLAVSVKSASKKFGHYWKSTTVLHDITLQVPRGTMYSIFLILL